MQLVIFAPGRIKWFSTSPGISSTGPVEPLLYLSSGLCGKSADDPSDLGVKNMNPEVTVNKPSLFVLSFRLRNFLGGPAEINVAQKLPDH